MTLTLRSLLDTPRIAVNLDAPTKPDVLHALADLAGTSDAVTDPELLLADIRAREALISTGVGEGIALPHARTRAVTQTVAAFATLAEPVDYDSLDGAPVRLVLLIAGPESERHHHVRLLSRVSRVLSDSETRDRLAASKTASDVLAAFEDAESRLA